MTDIRELLPDYALGQLEGSALDSVEEALDRSADLRAELAAIEDAYFGLAAALPVTPPSHALRDKLLRAAQGPERFMPFAKDLARYADLAVEKMRALLSSIDDAASWVAGPMPGIMLIDFDGGPRAVGPDVGFVRLPAGLKFPRHKHHGFEVTYILSGRLVDDDGAVYGPGMALEKDATQQHSFHIPEDADCLLFVAQTAFEIL